MSAIAALLAGVRALHERTPELSSYAPWPSDLSTFEVRPHLVEAAQNLGVQSLRGTRGTARIIKALRRAAPKLEWRQTYTAEEAGERFLRTYGYVELFGPTGHFRSKQLRGYLGFWGPDLTFNWHAHEAEELYSTLAGQAIFAARGASNVSLKPVQARSHASNQPHMMITLDQPYLCYVLWRGAGLDGLPRMVAS